MGSAVRTHVADALALVGNAVGVGALARRVGRRRPGLFAPRGLAMRPYDLLVFDWDGTLVDSIASIVDCTQRALAEVGAGAVEDAKVREAIGQEVLTC